MLSPKSDRYGYDLSTPADRPYIDAILAARQAVVRGFVSVLSKPPTLLRQL